MPFEYFCHSHSETAGIADSFFCISITRDILLNTSKMGNPQSRKIHSCTSSRKTCLKFTNVLGLSNRRKSMYYQSSSRHVGVDMFFFFWVKINVAAIVTSNRDFYKFVVYHITSTSILQQLQSHIWNRKAWGRCKIQDG